MRKLQQRPGFKDFFKITTVSGRMQIERKITPRDQFVHAMRDAGCLVRSRPGSAVAFAVEGKGRIVFQRPHPEAKLYAIMMRAMGKRLAKWFGWQLESFQLATA